MRKDEIEQLKKRAREEYQREKAALQQKLADLEMNHNARLAAILWLEQATEASDRPHTTIAKIRDAVSRMKLRKFTRMDVEAALASLHGTIPSRAVIVKALAIMVEEGTLRIDIVGRGRRATVFGYSRSSGNLQLAVDT